MAAAASASAYAVVDRLVADSDGESSEGRFNHIDWLAKAAKSLTDESCTPLERDVTIAVVGSSRSGKTVLGKVVANPAYVAPGMSLFAGTQTVEYKSTSFGTAPSTTKLTVIDVPGIAESVPITHGDTTRKRTDTELIDLFKEAVNGIRLDHVFITISFSAGISRADIDAIKKYGALFEGKMHMLSMVITRSEEMSKDDRWDIMSQLTQHPDMAPFIRSICHRVFFSGAFVAEHKSQYETPGQMRFGFSKVLMMRNKIVGYINKSTPDVLHFS